MAKKWIGLVALLAGCQATPPLGVPVAAGDVRMQARSANDVPARLQAVPRDQLEAINNLDQPTDGRLANATFTLDSVPYEAAEAKLKNVVFADYVAALSEAQRNGITSVVPSLNLVDGVCKQVNDGVYARLEVLWERQHTAPLRAKLLAALTAAWTAHPDDEQWQDLLAKVAVGAKVAGEDPAIPAAMQARVAKELADFEADPARAKPLGFYVLTEDLRRIYRTGRALQALRYFNNGEGMDTQAVRGAALATSLVAADATLGKDLDDTGSFYQRMANPYRAFSPTSLLPLLPTGTDWTNLDPAQLYQAAGAAKRPGMLLASAWIPPSGSVEDALFDQAPEGEPDLMAYLIREVKAGHVSLAPKPDSGFYQYQQYALEALLTPEKQPEGQKIHFGDAYLKRLEEAFKTGLAKARETQVKQTCWGCTQPTSVAPPPAKPRMLVEPVGTVYKRYGDMYDFLERQVLPLFPADALAEKTIDEAGEGKRDVRSQVAYAKELMYGLYLASCVQLGQTPGEVPVDKTTALKVAKTWLMTYQSDPYVAADTRVAVPIRQTGGDDPIVTYWGTAGVSLVKLQYAYDQKPEGSYEAEPATYFVAADKFITFKRPRSAGLLDRAAYRGILDGASSLEEATRRLEAR